MSLAAPWSPDFGFEGDAFVALFGDLAPVTTPRQVVPAGFKVVRVEMRNRQVVDFTVNKIAGPSFKLPHDSFERPSHCAFGPDGALYVVDWGEIGIAPEAGGVRMVEGTGHSYWSGTGETVIGPGSVNSSPFVALAARSARAAATAPRHSPISRATNRFMRIGGVQRVYRRA